jgi:dihydroorotate dehydrogenase (fumarate)
MDLSTTYMGLDLPGPLVASASPLNARLENLLELQAMGGGCRRSALGLRGTDRTRRGDPRGADRPWRRSYGEALSYFPPQTAQSFDTERQFDLLEQAARRLDIPVIASLNGITDSGWIDYAQRFQDAGASAIELNIFLIPSDPTVTGEAVEARYVDVTAAVASSVDIPVAVKIGPYFSSPGHLAGRLVAAGARGLVLFNRFFQPDIDPDTLSVEPSLALSNGFEMRLPLLWIGVLAGRLDASLAATTGVETARDAAKYLLAGADVVMTTSALLRHGIGHMRVLNDGLADWLSARGASRLSDIRGVLSHGRIDDPEAYERANYIRVLQGYSAR